MYLYFSSANNALNVSILESYHGSHNSYVEKYASIHKSNQFHIFVHVILYEIFTKVAQQNLQLGCAKSNDNSIKCFNSVNKC